MLFFCPNLQRSDVHNLLGFRETHVLDDKSGNAGHDQNNANKHCITHPIIPSGCVRSSAISNPSIEKRAAATRSVQWTYTAAAKSEKLAIKLTAAASRKMKNTGE
jgi:hypothetical protein